MTSKKKKDVQASSAFLPTPHKLVKTDDSKFEANNLLADRFEDNGNKNKTHANTDQPSSFFCDSDLDLEYDQLPFASHTPSAVTQIGQCPGGIYAGTQSLWITQPLQQVTQGERSKNVCTEESLDQGLHCFQGPVVAAPGQDASDLEDLLYQFQNFFQDRVDMEVRLLHQSLCGILQEQQSHVRQIIHTTVRESSSQSYSDEYLYDDSALGSSGSSCKVDDTASGQVRNVCMEYEPQLVSQQNCDTTAQKHQQVLELMTAACSVSTLLSQPQYRT